MCIIHSGMAYAIYIDIFIVMLLITCRNTWTELQPHCRCEFMAYAIHSDIFIIMLLITCRNTWTELQPQCRCEFMKNV